MSCQWYFISIPSSPPSSLRFLFIPPSILPSSIPSPFSFSSSLSFIYLFSILAVLLMLWLLHPQPFFSHFDQSEIEILLTYTCVPRTSAYFSAACEIQVEQTHSHTLTEPTTVYLTCACALRHNKGYQQPRLWCTVTGILWNLANVHTRSGHVH